jgi:hypothetical protein
MLARYQAGESIGAVAKAFGVTRQCVHFYAKKHGRLRPRLLRASAVDDDAILALVRSRPEATQPQIAVAAGVSESSVWRVLRRARLADVLGDAA